MDMFLSDLHIVPIISTVVYSLIGIVLFILGFVIFDKLTPYSIHKEIGEDHNVALGVIIAAIMISLSIIIAAAIKG